MDVANKIKISNNGTVNVYGLTLPYCETSTPAATAAKIAVCDGGSLELANGMLLVVSFANGSTVANPTLNINNSGDKPICSNGSAILPGQIKVGDRYLLYYDGQRFNIVGMTGDLNTKLDVSLKGAAGGLAELDLGGKIPSSQLPAYVDDVLEFDGISNFPATGETGKIYVDISENGGNRTYRWSGTTYVEISASLALGETSSTAYRGDRGKTAYDHATDPDRQTTETESGLYKVAVTDEGHIASTTSVTKDDIVELGIQDSKLFVVDLDPVSNLSGAYTHTSNITGVSEEMKAIKLDLSDPSIFKDHISIETGDGTVTLTCNDVEGTSTVKVALMYTSGPNALTTSEFDILSERIDDILTNRTIIDSSSLMRGATSTSAGNPGLVPAPGLRLVNRLLQSDGTWTNTINTGRKDGTTVGANSTAEGYNTTASGSGSHAEGSSTVAQGTYSHAEGYSTVAQEPDSHAEGYFTTASGYSSHAEGGNTVAQGSDSHAEGTITTASGDAAHAEGCHTVAQGIYSHAEGYYTTASKQSQHVFGEYNTVDPSTADPNERGNYVEIVGNGSSNSSRSNARTLDWNGNEVLSGDLTIDNSTTPISVRSLKNPMVGATELADGVSGMVPQPTIGDKDKVLKGDGTWGTASGGKLIVFDLDDVTNVSGSYTHTTNVPGVTSEMKPIRVDFGDPSIFMDAVNVTTGEGTITLSCNSVVGTSTAKVSLMLVSGMDALTSAEFDVLSTRIANLLTNPSGGLYFPLDKLNTEYWLSSEANINGGYARIGDIVFVNLRLTAANDIPSGTTTIFSAGSFPIPKQGSFGTGNMVIGLVSVRPGITPYISTDGALMTNSQSAAISNSEAHFFTGVYLAEHEVGT